MHASCEAIQTQWCSLQDTNADSQDSSEIVSTVIFPLSLTSWKVMKLPHVAPTHVSFSSLESSSVQYRSWHSYHAAAMASSHIPSCSARVSSSQLKTLPCLPFSKAECHVMSICTMSHCAATYPDIRSCFASLAENPQTPDSHLAFSRLGQYNTLYRFDPR